MRHLLLPLYVALAVAPARAQLARTTSHPDVQSLQLTLAPHVTEELDALADTLRVETVRCLIGVVRGEKATVDLAWQPPIEMSTANHVRYKSCPSATLALWHNHPPIPGEEPEYACYLSGTDVREALHARAPPIQMVQVTADVACWWSQWEIAQTGLVPVLLPRGRQRWGRPLQLDEAACRETLHHVLACALLFGCEPRSAAVGECTTTISGRDVARAERELQRVVRDHPCEEASLARLGCSSPEP